jgi:serine/threonine-protein kinase RsbW
MREAVALHLKNDLLEIEKMVGQVGHWCRLQRLPEELELQIDLVLDEVVSNVIRHGFNDGKEHIIEVSLGRENDLLSVTIEDDGRPFNPLDSPDFDVDQPIEARRIGGMGIHLVRQIMDTVTYERREGKNCLLMTKRRSDEL